MNSTNRKQNGNRVTIEHMSSIGELKVECYEIDGTGLEMFVGYMYPGMAAMWRARATDSSL